MFHSWPVRRHLCVDVFLPVMQIMHCKFLLQNLKPFKTLVDLRLVHILALTRMSFRFLCLLYATNDGLGKHRDRYLLWLVITFQHLLKVAATDGRAGWYVTTRGSRSVDGLSTFFNASRRRILQTLLNASSTTFGWYCLESRSCRNSSSLFLKVDGSLHIRNRRYPKEKGILFVTCMGWHDDGSRYWQTAVSFLKRSVDMCTLLSMDTDISRKGAVLLLIS